jgi:lipid-A-disaccharide synthase-like uncharacterized protein
MGLVYHFLAVLLLAAAGTLGLLQASLAAVGPAFLLFVLPAVLAVSFGPVLLYNAYSLWSASYTLERDGIRLQWGLRTEDIPMDTVQWVRTEAALREHLPVPVWHWPGAVLGRKYLRDGTPVEFLASRSHNLLLIATPTRVYAISPAHPDEFLQAFQTLAELGTISPVAARSVYPAFLLSRLGSDRRGLALLLGGLLLSLGLLFWVGVSVRTRATITWQTPTLQAAEAVPAVRLFLLPVLNLVFFTADALLGLFFYRRNETRVASYLLWGVSLLTSGLFLGATIFILNA